MKTKRTIYLALLMTLGVLTWACQKEKEDDTDRRSSVPFCNHVEAQNFDATLPLINTYLSTQNMGSPDENLDELVEWLQSKSCVTNAELNCNSCLETAPPRSIVEVEFDSNKIAVSKTLIVLMGDQLTAVHYR